SGEAANLLARCEEKLGHPEDALAAYSRIGHDSPLFLKAAVARGWILIHLGRLGLAEQVLSPLPRSPSSDGAQVLQVYEHLLRLELRNREARELIVESWRGSPDPSHVLRRLYILEDAAFPVDYVADVLNKGDPGDDRVWLGRANLAIWTGRFDEAARWLDA